MKISPSNQNLKDTVLREIDESKERLFQISKTLYENPEVGLKEYKSAKLLSSELEKNGFYLEMGIAGMETSFKTVFNGMPGGPTIAILAEYDALPGVGHGCGHNIIGTAAIGAAISLCKVMSKIKGRIMVLGTPFEEGGAKGGKIPMVEQGFFDDVDATLMIHPVASVRSGEMVHPKTVNISSLALGAVEIRFKGKAAHASGSPDLGVNALDAVIQTFNSLNALRQHIRSDARIHGIITEGGKAPNIVPDEAAAYFYVRAEDTKYMLELMEKLKNCAASGALATGAKLEFNQDPYHMDPLKPNYTLQRLLEKNLESLGEKVIARTQKRRQRKVSTDRGNVSHVVPSASLLIAICPKGTLGHSKDMADCTVSEQGKHGLLLGTKALALSCIDLFTDLELQKIKEEFKKS